MEKSQIKNRIIEAIPHNGIYKKTKFRFLFTNRYLVILSANQDAEPWKIDYDCIRYVYRTSIGIDIHTEASLLLKIDFSDGTITPEYMNRQIKQTSKTIKKTNGLLN
ncbi:MAG: hypothetical protein PUB21_07815 [Bacteroidales bacterium]|nr:hypothetical protein [Bacteroidales bacterium]